MPLTFPVWLLAFLLVACATTSSTETSSTDPSVPAPPGTSSDSTAPTSSSATGNRSASPFEVLVFHKTTGFRHSSIQAGIEALEALGGEHEFTVTATEDAAVFSESGLSRYDVVVFLNTTGDVLDRDQELGMEEFLEAGGGYVGVHSASDTEYDWSWYGNLVGAYFDSHPEPQHANLVVVTPQHPIVRAMPETFERYDEWYNFQTLPGEGVTVLVAIDETSYEGGTMGELHPISWAHENLGGRSFYTAMGHTEESFDDPLFLTHLVNGILWAAGRS